jgi:hypothetical protein
MQSQNPKLHPSDVPHNIKRLAMAVILQGLKDYYTLSDDPESDEFDDQESARLWLLGHQTDNVFSFKWCCDILGVQYRRLQNAIESGDVNIDAVSSLRLYMP